MVGASVEQVLGLWAAELGGLKARIRPLFAHPSVAASALAFLDGRLGPERRKTGWMRAEAAGDRGPWRQQAVLGRSHWAADTVYGGDDVQTAVRRAGKGYVLGIPASQLFWSRSPEGVVSTSAEELAQ